MKKKRNNQRKRLLLFILSLALLCNCTNSNLVISKSKIVQDTLRSRGIPIEIYTDLSAAKHKEKLVIISAGYGSSNTEYSYIAKDLAAKSYLVICIQHEIQTDEMLPSGEDVYTLRLPNWREGVKSLQAVITYVKQKYPNIRTDDLHLIGHSNGGDISVLFAREYPLMVKTCISLDHRRMPIPKSSGVGMLTIRADEFEADEGVIPDEVDLVKYGIEVINLQNVGHNYMRDNGTMETKNFIAAKISSFIEVHE